MGIALVAIGGGTAISIASRGRGDRGVPEATATVSPTMLSTPTPDTFVVVEGVLREEETNAPATVPTTLHATELNCAPFTSETTEIANIGRGTIPTCLGGLTQLTMLRLSLDRLTEQFPPNWGI